jgi:glycosyltransferase involved in cell wall biosynthesis
MKISIITPTWNRCDSLSRMIQSVEAQFLIPFEHLVIDNLSTDRTADLVHNYAARAPYPVIHVRNGDKGIYDAMNQGAARARGDALYFLNDDDALFRPNSLTLLSSALKLVPGGLAFGDVIVRDPSTGDERRRNHRQMNQLTLAEKSICQQATIYSLKAFAAVGFFDSRLKAAGDYDWMIRGLVGLRIPAIYLRSVVAIFASGGISSDPARNEEFRAEMNLVTARHFPAALRARALRYRRLWRKLPWGLNLCPGHEKADRLSITTRTAFQNYLLPDPLALLDF